MNADTSLVEVYRARNGPQAHLIKAVLEEAGIETHVGGETLAGVLWHLGWSTAPRILVLESDAARAHEILHEIEKGESSE